MVTTYLFDLFHWLETSSETCSSFDESQRLKVSNQERKCAGLRLVDITALMFHNFEPLLSSRSTILNTSMPTVSIIDTITLVIILIYELSFRVTAIAPFHLLILIRAQTVLRCSIFCISAVLIIKQCNNINGGQLLKIKYCYFLRKGTSSAL